VTLRLSRAIRFELQLIIVWIKAIEVERTEKTEGSCGGPLWWPAPILMEIRAGQKMQALGRNKARELVGL
jgi:hypothetical protein